MYVDIKLADLATKLSKELNVSFIPERQSSLAAGHDLRACIEYPVTIYPYVEVPVTIPTGIHISMENISGVDDLLFAGFIIPRSGLGSKGFRLANTIGCIDMDYQGEILIKALNGGNMPIVIEPGDRIAQLLFIPCAIANFIEVKNFDAVTERGENGFNSTGMS